MDAQLQLLRSVALTPQAAGNEEYDNLRKQSLDGMKSLHADRQRAADRQILNSAAPRGGCGVTVVAAPQQPRIGAAV